MSRPDDAISPHAGHPTGWPRQNDQIARDPVTGRPLAHQAAPMAPVAQDTWQAGHGGGLANGHPGHQGYHYAAPDAGQFYPPAGPPAAPAQQHYQPQAQPGPRTQPGGHAPQFARYSGAVDPQQPGYAPEAYQPPQPPAYVNPAAAPPSGPDPHWPGGHAPYQNLQTGDPRTYDQQAYAPPGQGAGYGLDAGQHGQYAPAQSYADPNAGYPQQGYPQGYQDAAYQQGHYAPQEQGYDPRTGQPYAPHDGYAQSYGQNGAALDPGQPISGGETGYDDYAAEPAPRKRRGLLVAGALVCAVAVGGGLAFVYKTFGQSGKRIGPPPVVGRPSTPSKVAAADPQGRQIENINKKVLAKLDDAGGSAATASAAGSTTPIVPGMVVSMPPAATEPAAGPPATRTVQTVPIGRDGNPVGGQQQAVTPRGLPGVQIDNSLNPPAMRGAIPTADSQQPVTSAPGKQQPQRLAAANPAASPDASEPGAVLPKAKKLVVPKAPPKEAAASGAAAAPTPAAVGASGSGYVAVLSSQKDRAAALRIFADLAQKYPDQLGSRQPEVQEANLGDKGVWQRLVIGPPSSQQSAKELCSQLKAAGHSGDCWAKQY